MTETTVRHTIRFTLNGEAVTARVRAARAPRRAAAGGASGSCGARVSCRSRPRARCCTGAGRTGLAVSGCLDLAAFVDGTEVVTVEQPELTGNCSTRCRRRSLLAAPSSVDSARPAAGLMARQLLDETARPGRRTRSGTACRATCAGAGPHREIIDAVRAAARTRAKGKELVTGTCHRQRTHVAC